VSPLACALLLLCTVAARAQQPCTEDAMLVFDASKSMAAAAGDNAGLRRIDAVRSALARVLPRVAPKRRLGLMVYGPGSRPACVNVALELRPAINAATRIMARLDALKPDGRTPLTRAVRRAADVLDFRNRPATIVLITDGEETCQGAPCALAKTLKAEGAHTTVHVISYHIASAIGSEGVFASRCLADDTGGIYAATNTVDEVAAALETALACPMVSQAAAR
jgi:Ca-activated chloride channel family protein